jgi:hypothetical protein
MTHYVVYRLGPLDELSKYLNTQVPGDIDWGEPWNRKVKSKGWMSVQAAITALTRNNRISDLLRDCIAFTGDVDTVATIALAAASWSADYEQDLPGVLVSSLENGAYGREYLENLDVRLRGVVAQTD